MTPMNVAMYSAMSMSMRNTANSNGAESAEAVSAGMAVVVTGVVCVAIIAGAAWLVKKMVDWAYRKD